VWFVCSCDIRAVKARRAAARAASDATAPEDRKFLQFVPLQLFSRELRFNTMVGLLFCLGTLLPIWTSLMARRSWFSELQAALASGRQDEMVFLAFDLLFLEGFDLRDSPLIERKRVLKSLFDETGLSGPIQYADHLEAAGPRMFEHAGKLGFEGIVSKKADAPYRSDRNEAWLKVKCAQRAKFPVVGFVKDPTGVAALHLGRRHGKDLVYMGKVGTGWSRTVSSLALIETNEADQGSQGHLGRTGVRRRSRVPRHHQRRAAACELVQGPVKGIYPPLQRRWLGVRKPPGVDEPESDTAA
jgi:ATP dependent DNA ligase domain